MRRAAAMAILVGALVLAGCGDDPAEEPSPTGEPSPTVTATEEPTTPEEPTEPEQPTDGDLPGEAVEIHPYEGGGLGVMGVAADDVLHVRAGPGVDFDSLAQLEPLATDIVATGHNRQLEDGSFWAQIEVDGLSGWASPAFLAYPGQVTDITSELGELPTAASPEEAGQLVAEQRMDDHPPSATAIVVDGPHEGDLHEVMLDAVGYGDDAIAGERLHVFTVEDGDGYTVRTVEATVLCIRGVSEGLCL